MLFGRIEDVSALGGTSDLLFGGLEMGGMEIGTADATFVVGREWRRRARTSNGE